MECFETKFDMEIDGVCVLIYRLRENTYKHLSMSLKWRLKSLTLFKLTVS